MLDVGLGTTVLQASYCVSIVTALKGDILLHLVTDDSPSLVFLSSAGKESERDNAIKQ